PAWLYPLSLHDALPISCVGRRRVAAQAIATGEDQLGHALAERGAERQQLVDDRLLLEREAQALAAPAQAPQVLVQQAGPSAAYGDRKSTRLNSSHVKIS